MQAGEAGACEGCRPEGKLAEMREGLGDGACSLVRINSGDKDRKSGLGGLWQAQIRCLSSIPYARSDIAPNCVLNELETRSSVSYQPPGT